MARTSSTTQKSFFLHSILYYILSLPKSAKKRKNLYEYTILPQLRFTSQEVTRLRQVLSKGMTKQLTVKLSYVFTFGFIVALCAVLAVQAVRFFTDPAYFTFSYVQDVDNARAYLSAMFFYQAVLITLTAVGLIFKQRWGWFLAQYLLLVRLPSFLFSLFFVPSFSALGKSLVFGVGLAFLYMTSVRKIFFPQASQHISEKRFFAIVLFLSGVLFGVEEVVKSLI